MQNSNSLLIVEDERDIRNLLSAVLSSNGYKIFHADNGKAALSAIALYKPDLMLLDLGLPDMDGMAVLADLRKWSEMPVIVVSARQDEREKVRALDGGANDYVTKPFGNGELLARIRTALRLRAAGTSENDFSVFQAGGLRIDYTRRLVSVDGKPVHLTPIEYKMVGLLSKSSGKVLTRDHIINEIWGPYASDTQTLRVNMANIRRKLEKNPADPEYILTEVGVGYRMIEAENE